jgi:branched-chain amino acid transport system permease protein
MSMAAARPDAKPALPSWMRPIRPQHVLVTLFLVAYPLVASQFWTVQIGAQALFLGMIALSLMFLAGYGGMVSLSQMTVAGVAGYMVAVFGTNATHPLFNWPLWAAAPIAIVIATVFSIVIGVISVRTSGIYTIMITLAIGVATFYFVQQNYAIFNGHSGFAGLPSPVGFGVNWRDPMPFYYMSLVLAAVAYFAVLYVARSTFGIGLQAIRDNPRRMNALGFHVNLHRVIAHGFAGLLASVGGLLYVWMNGRVSPGTIDVGPVIDILVIAVIGGLRHPVGPFIGALLFVLMENFATDLISPERFNTLIGSIFLVIVLVSPDGLLGLWRLVSDRMKAGNSRNGGSRRQWRK